MSSDNPHTPKNDNGTMVCNVDGEPWPCDDADDKPAKATTTSDPKSAAIDAAKAKAAK